MVSDSQLRLALLALSFVFLLAALREMFVCWRDGIVRRNIKRRWRDDEWYRGADAWRYGLTRIIESAIVVAILAFAIFEWLKDV
jgi:hypothetical protein